MVFIIILLKFSHFPSRNNSKNSSCSLNIVWLVPSLISDYCECGFLNGKVNLKSIEAHISDTYMH